MAGSGSAGGGGRGTGPVVASAVAATAAPPALSSVMPAEGVLARMVGNNGVSAYVLQPSFTIGNNFNSNNTYGTSAQRQQQLTQLHVSECGSVAGVHARVQYNSAAGRFEIKVRV